MSTLRFPPPAASEEARAAEPRPGSGTRPSDVVDDALVGTTVLDTYRVERVLGRGGMGVVYLARDLRLDREVALKTMPPIVAMDPESVARFEREARAATRVSHPGLAQVYAFGRLATGEPYLAMEVVPGVSIAERLLTGAMGLTDIVARLTSVAGAIDALHAAGVVHRDVKPENIVIAEREGAPGKLIDFGLAVLDGAARGRLTTAGFIVGTPEYMAPETVSGDLSGPAGDIYALAVTIFEMLAGRAPFEGVPIHVLRDKQRGDAPTLSESTGRLFLPGVEDAISRSLRRDPRQRHPTAMALIDELSRYTRRRK